MKASSAGVIAGTVRLRTGCLDFFFIATGLGYP
jgi:hypothetical protein